MGSWSLLPAAKRRGYKTQGTAPIGSGFSRWFLLLALLVISVSGCGSNVTVTTVLVSPSSRSIGIGHAQQFYAAAYDSTNALLTKTFTWTTTGGIGTIDANGVFYAVNTEVSGTVVATTDNVSGSSAVKVTAKGILTGKLTNASAAKVSSLYVSLVGQSFSAASDTNGTYTIEEIPYGTYEAKTQETVKYVSSTAEVSIATGETTTKNFTLTDRLSIGSENISGNPLTITGNVTNHGTTDAVGVTVAYIFYDEEGYLSSSGSQALGTVSSLEASIFYVVPSPPISTYSSVTKTVAATSY